MDVLAVHEFLPLDPFDVGKMSGVVEVNEGGEVHEKSCQVAVSSYGNLATFLHAFGDFSDLMLR